MLQKIFKHTVYNIAQWIFLKIYRRIQILFTNKIPPWLSGTLHATMVHTGTIHGVKIPHWYWYCVVWWSCAAPPSWKFARNKPLTISGPRGKHLRSQQPWSDSGVLGSTWISSRTVKTNHLQCWAAEDLACKAEKQWSFLRRWAAYRPS